MMATGAKAMEPPVRPLNKGPEPVMLYGPKAVMVPLVKVSLPEMLS